jgi:hypothetical protein
MYWLRPQRQLSGCAQVRRLHVGPPLVRETDSPREYDKEPESVPMKSGQQARVPRPVLQNHHKALDGVLRCASAI